MTIVNLLDDLESSDLEMIMEETEKDTVKHLF